MHVGISACCHRNADVSPLRKAHHIREEAYVKGLYKTMLVISSVDSTPLVLIYLSDGLKC